MLQNLRCHSLKLSDVFSRALSIRFKSDAVSIAELEKEFEGDQVAVDEEEALQKEMEIQAKRNKSRLSAAHYNVMHGQQPYGEAKLWIHNTVRYKRRMFGRFGESSGVDASLCWPDRSTLADMMEVERIAHPEGVQAIAEKARQQREEEHARILQREQDIVARLEKLEGWKQDLQTRLKKRRLEAQAAKEKKDRLVEEVRRHFGFKVDHRDERFKEMLAQREKEQAKADKLARRAAKEAATLAKLQQKNQEISS